MAVKIFGIISLIFLAVSCNTTEPPPPPPEKIITLAIEDVSSIEAWIKLTTSNLPAEGGPPTIIILKQNDSIRDSINLASADTLLYIDSLLPNKTYTFQSLYHPINQSEVKSNELSVTTMDTTNHNFTWQTWEFGEHGNSILRDVAIIDENNIWAVGAIYLNDSLGNRDPQPNGVAEWNGQTWELRKLFYNNNLIVAPIRGIFVISPNEIYLAAGSIFRWDGTSSIVQLVYSRLSLPDPNGTIEKLWGSSNSSIYGIGNVGSIVFYNGTTWSRIESGTEVDLLDICGTPDGSTIWVTGNDSGNNFHSVLLKYNGTTWYKLYEGPPNNQNNGYNIGLLRAVWTKSNLFTFLMNTDAVYRQYNKPELDIILSVELNDAGFAMRGSEINNIFIIGQHGYVVHNNGISYKEIEGLKNNNDKLYSVDVKDNITCIVGKKDLGFIYDRAIIHILK